MRFLAFPYYGDHRTIYSSGRFFKLILYFLNPSRLDTEKNDNKKLKEHFNFFNYNLFEQIYKLLNFRPFRKLKLFSHFYFKNQKQRFVSFTPRSECFWGKKAHLSNNPKHCFLMEKECGSQFLKVCKKLLAKLLKKILNLESLVNNGNSSVDCFMSYWYFPRKTELKNKKHEILMRHVKIRSTNYLKFSFRNVFLPKARTALVCSTCLSTEQIVTISKNVRMNLKKVSQEILLLSICFCLVLIMTAIHSASANRRPARYGKRYYPFANSG